MGGLNNGPKHPLSGADPEFYFDPHVVPTGSQPEERVTAGTWRIITRFTPGGGARWPWSAAHLGEGNSDNKPMGRRDSSALVGFPSRR